MHGGLVTLSAHTGETLRQVQLSLVTDGEIKQFLFGKKMWGIRQKVQRKNDELATCRQSLTQAG